MESTRLRLRRFKLSDLQNLAELESDPEVIKFSPLRVPLPLEQTQERLKSLLEKEQSREPLGVWAVELKETCDFVGWFMLIKTQYEHPELGFMIVRRHWGQGFATEAAQCLIDFGFNDLNLQAIVAATDEDNVSSQRVLAKLGFRFSRVKQIADKILQKDISLNVFELHK